MKITWPEIVAALERLGRTSPMGQPGLPDRVMHRLRLGGTLPASTQLSLGATVQPGSATRVAAPAAEATANGSSRNDQPRPHADGATGGSPRGVTPAPQRSR
jgi:hypothetical protein